MHWYYVNEVQERLAVDESELPPLVRGGMVRPQTLLWRDGLPEWVAAGEVMPELFLDARPAATATTGAEAPLGRLALDPLLRVRGWLAPLAGAAFAAGAVELPGALERFGRDPAGAIGQFLRIAFFFVLGGLLIQWLIAQHLAARDGQLVRLRAASKSGGRVVAIAGIAAILYLLSVIYSLIATVASGIAGH